MLKRKHTIKFLTKWLIVNGYLWTELKMAYRKATMRIPEMDDVLSDSVDTWRYYLNCY